MYQVRGGLRLAMNHLLEQERMDGERDEVVEAQPNPGSSEAVRQGCKCPVMDNNYGQGVWMGAYGRQWWRSSDCLLHGQPSPRAAVNEMERGKGECS
jgi:hypothetical protein